MEEVEEEMVEEKERVVGRLLWVCVLEEWEGEVEKGEKKMRERVKVGGVGYYIGGYEKVGGVDLGWVGGEMEVMGGK